MGDILKNSIRILTVIRHPVGGIRTYLKYTYGHLNKDKYHFTILTVKDPETEVIKNDLKDFDLEIIETEGYPLLPRMILKLCLLLQGRRFDVIHSHGFTAGILAVIANILKGTPHIITSHDVFRIDQFSSRYGNLKKKCIEVLLGQADIIQSVSHDAQKNLIQFLPKLGKQTDKLVVIVNGISLDHLSVSRNGNNYALRKILGVDKDIILFGFLGRFMPQKGFTYLIDAVEELSKDAKYASKFKVIAVNEGAFIREYKAIICEKGLTDFFIFHDFIPNIADIMLELDAVVIPSLWEACPLLPMEAFVLGCPVIATECVGLKEVVSNTPTVIIKKTEDSFSIAEGLRHFISDSIQIKKDSLEYISKGKSRFDVKHPAKTLNSLFLKTTR